MILIREMIPGTRLLGTVVESLGRTRGFNRRLDLSGWNLDVATYSGDLNNLEVADQLSKYLHENGLDGRDDCDCFTGLFRYRKRNRRSGRRQRLSAFDAARTGAESRQSS